VRRAALILLATISLASCAPREIRRGRSPLATEAAVAALSGRDGRVFEEVSRALQGKTIRIVRGSTATDLGEAERDVVLGMLADRTGVFDEGLRSGGGRQARVFNAPGQSNNPEIEASRRLFVDVETFLPLRFEFAYAFPSPDDNSYDLQVNYRLSSGLHSPVTETAEQDGSTRRHGDAKARG
jgi:hypothetical protein